MSKAVIAIDDWKLPVFEVVLKREKFNYRVIPGITKGTLMIKVTVDFVSRLQPFVEEANNEATNLKVRGKA